MSRFRITLATIIVILTQVSSAYSSVLQTKLSINTRQEPLHKVLKQIETRTGITFAYTTNAIKQNRPITLKRTDLYLEDLLKILLYEDGARFMLIDMQIIIYQPGTKPNLATENFEPVRDTVRIEITNTVNVYDTVSFTVSDTMKVYDTVIVKQPRKRDFRRKKDNFVAIQAGGVFGKMDFSPIESPYLRIDRCQQQQYSATLLLGQRAKFWEISTGAGIAVARQQIPYVTTAFETRTLTDSTAYIQKSVDSMYITIPGVDTSWFTIEKNTLAYRISTSQRTDTITNSRQLSAKQLYLQIPVYVAFRTDLSRKTSFRAGIGLVSHILLSPASAQVFDGTDVSASYRPQPAFISGGVYAGFGCLCSKSIELFLSAKTETWLTPPTLQDEITAKRTLLYGVNLGVRKYF